MLLISILFITNSVFCIYTIFDTVDVLQKFRLFKPGFEGSGLDFLVLVSVLPVVSSRFFQILLERLANIVIISSFTAVVDPENFPFSDTILLYFDTDLFMNV